MIHSILVHCQPEVQTFSFYFHSFSPPKPLTKPITSSSTLTMAFYFFFFFFFYFSIGFVQNVYYPVGAASITQCKKPPVIFVFGDSNSDTGGLVAGLGFPVNPPYGRSFFARSTGRLSDGRLLIDFLCKLAPLPPLIFFLSACNDVCPLSN